MAVLVGCGFNTNSITETKTPVSPTKKFSGKNSFGDGYIAHVPIDDVKQESQEEIVNILVTQWLEHYKSDSTIAYVSIIDYRVENVSLIDRNKDNDPSIVAEVQFSIMPAQIPNGWASFSGIISPNDPWWHLGCFFGVFGDSPNSDYYWLRILPLG